MAAVQPVIAAIPFALCDEWPTSFLVTAAGTMFAFASGSLPRSYEEKLGVCGVWRARARAQKDVWLAQSNGAHDALLIRWRENGIDLEELASPQRNFKHPWRTRALPLFFFFWAVLWVAMLFSVAGHDQNTWYLVAVRMAGILHNVAVAGITRAPAAYGIDLRLKETIMEDKVMACLGSTEEAYPMARPFSSGDFLPWKAVSARAVVVGVC